MYTSKILDFLKICNKKGVFEFYTRIIKDFKDYDKITKNKMIDAICKEYSDYKNIISICTVRELKYLKLILNGESKESLLDKKYSFEIKNLLSKLLIISDPNHNVCIPLEFEDYVKEALENVEWSVTKKYDKLNEFMVGYCKTVGIIDLDVLCSLTSQLFGLDEGVVYDFTCYNKVFNYYIFTYCDDSDIETKNMAIYNDYFDFLIDIQNGKVDQGISGIINVSSDYYKTIFYNDYDINNEKIQKLLNAFDGDYFDKFLLEEVIPKYALLNKDRSSLKEIICEHRKCSHDKCKELFDILDAAMDEMPSAVLNGMSPNQARDAKIKKLENNKIKDDNYVKQRNACLSKKDAKLFYKIYFALLEFTNNKFNIKPNLKIYNKLGLKPENLIDIVNMFWERKDALIFEFCLANPYNFNKEELSIAKEFRKGIRDLFVIAKFLEEHTGVLYKDKVYMIKGISDNLDNIINYKDLPKVVFTTILPFKEVLIYDGILSDFDVDIDAFFEKGIIENFDKSMKYYHI